VDPALDEMDKLVAQLKELCDERKEIDKQIYYTRQKVLIVMERAAVLKVTGNESLCCV
jgi:hypothetical protein